MNQEPQKQTDKSLMGLPVVQQNEKLEQLKAQLRLDRPGPPHGPTSGYIPHVNRVKFRGEYPAAQQAVEEKVVNVLRSIFDPEIPVNLYDLGLIYDVDVDFENRVHIRMTLTAPGCPVAGTLPGEVESKIENIPEVQSATVELVWEPQWTKEMMSEVAKLELGF